MSLVKLFENIYSSAKTIKYNETRDSMIYGTTYGDYEDDEDFYYDERPMRCELDFSELSEGMDVYSEGEFIGKIVKKSKRLEGLADVSDDVKYEPKNFIEHANNIFGRFVAVKHPDGKVLSYPYGKDIYGVSCF